MMPRTVIRLLVVTGIVIAYVVAFISGDSWLGGVLVFYLTFSISLLALILSAASSSPRLRRMVPQ